MTRDEVLTGVLLDALTVEEIARACAVEPDWIVARVEAGLLECHEAGGRWQFASAELVRARRLIALERDLDASPELAALIADLVAEIRRLRAQRL